VERGLLGGLSLTLYGIITTFQSFPTFGRYAAYGGIFIILSILWGWGVDKKTPDLYDWIGAFICLLGVSVMLFANRCIQNLKGEGYWRLNYDQLVHVLFRYKRFCFTTFN